MRVQGKDQPRLLDSVYQVGLQFPRVGSSALVTETGKEPSSVVLDE